MCINCHTDISCLPFSNSSLQEAFLLNIHYERIASFQVNVSPLYPYSFDIDPAIIHAYASITTRTYACICYTSTTITTHFINTSLIHETGFLCSPTFFFPNKHRHRFVQHRVASGDCKDVCASKRMKEKRDGKEGTDCITGP